MHIKNQLPVIADQSKTKMCYGRDANTEAVNQDQFISFLVPEVKNYHFVENVGGCHECTEKNNRGE